MNQHGKERLRFPSLIHDETNSLTLIITRLQYTVHSTVHVHFLLLSDGNNRSHQPHPAIITTQLLSLTIWPSKVLSSSHTPHTQTRSQTSLSWGSKACGHRIPAALTCAGTAVTHYSGGSGGFLVATWTHTKGLWVTLPVWCRGPVIWRWVGGHR